MPQIFRFGPYWVYFWTNESKPLEPIHVHISEGKPAPNYGSPGPENVLYAITIHVSPVEFFEIWKE